LPLYHVPCNNPTAISMNVTECRTSNAGQNLSIVIITRNTKELLRNLLKSIEADKLLRPFLKEVIIVDNYSTDGSNTMVGSEFPWVFLVKNDYNRGFAAAANVGIARAEGSYIFLLNSDTLLIEGEVAKMVQFMEENRDVGICGPQLVHEDMRHQRSYANIPSLLFEIVPRSLMEMLFPARHSTKSLQEDSASHIPSPLAHTVLRPRSNASMFPPLSARQLFYGKNSSLTLVGLMNDFFSFSKRLTCVSGPGKLGHVLFFSLMSG